MLSTTNFDPSDRLLLIIERANNLPAADMNGLSDPYSIVKLNDSFEKKTKIIKKNLNPVWNEEFIFFSLGGRDPLKITIDVYDWDRFSSDDFLGCATLLISSANLEFNQMHQQTLELVNQSSESIKGTVSVFYKVVRKEQRESGMFPSITQSSVVSSESSSQLEISEKQNSFFNYEFSPSFCPSLPMNFKLLSVKKEKKVICQCDFEGPHEKPKNNITKEPGILQISYFKIPKGKFTQINTEYLTSYFDRLKNSTELMNSQNNTESEVALQVKDITNSKQFVGSGGAGGGGQQQYQQILEHFRRENTTDGLLSILNVSCLVGDSLMVIYRYVSYTYEQQRERGIILEIVKQSKIVDVTAGANSIRSPSSPPSSSSSSGTSGTVNMKDEDYSSLYSPSRMLSSSLNKYNF